MVEGQREERALRSHNPKAFFTCLDMCMMMVPLFFFFVFFFLSLSFQYWKKKLGKKNDALVFVDSVCFFPFGVVHPSSRTTQTASSPTAHICWLVLFFAPQRRILPNQKILFKNRPRLFFVSLSQQMKESIMLPRGLEWWTILTG